MCPVMYAVCFHMKDFCYFSFHCCSYCCCDWILWKKSLLVAKSYYVNIFYLIFNLAKKNVCTCDCGPLNLYCIWVFFFLLLSKKKILNGCMYLLKGFSCEHNDYKKYMCSHGQPHYYILAYVDCLQDNSLKVSKKKKKKIIKDQISFFSFHFYFYFRWDKSKFVEKKKNK